MRCAMSDFVPRGDTMKVSVGRRALLATALCAGSAAAQVDAQAVLAASDAVRNPGRPFGVIVTLIEYKNRQQTEANTLQVYSKSDRSGGGQYRTLIRFLDPPRDANKLMLKSGNDLWFYDPSSQSSIRLSPQQRLLGQAANGDVVTVDLAKDYLAEWVADEEIADGERVKRKTHRLKLVARAQDVTYHQVEFWIEAQTARPIKALFYAESGRLLKTAYYRKVAPALGKDRPTEVVIIDGLDPGWVTVMRYSDFAWREVPDTWLQRDYLPRFKPE
jgi:hypothetical protein